jgi:4-hydroxy-tetrahydrodipicolinate reductase
MNIALIGYGKMGKEIEAVAASRNILISKIIDERENAGGSAITAAALKDVDVCIEFSSPASAVMNIEAAAAAGKNIVVGTTGWYDRLDSVKKIVAEKKIGLLYSPNFSLGMNIFNQILASASHWIDQFDMYDIALSEIHHRNKVDSPSGTALALGQIILQHVRRKTEMMHESPHRKMKPGEIHVTSTRVGNVVGTHRVLFDSDADSIELVHNAKNRQGFALGALIAAEWLKGKKGVFTMKDVFAV